MTEKLVGLIKKRGEIMFKNISKQKSTYFTISSIMCGLDFLAEITKYVHQIVKDQQSDHPGLASIFYLLYDYGVEYRAIKMSDHQKWSSVASFH